MKELNQFVHVTLDGTDITEYVISYERMQSMCTCVDTLSLIASPALPVSPKPWRTIKITEGVTLKGEYYINEGGVRQPDGCFVIEAQDNSKRAVDYFITDIYTPESESSARFWINKFLQEAGIDVKFKTESGGGSVAANTSLGLMSVYEQVLYLLQLSGWYMYFDRNGTAIIGKIEVDSTKVGKSIKLATLTEGKVISHDRMLRNRVVVWGGTQILTSGNIFVDISKITPWNYDEEDLRAVVIANSNISTKAQAGYLAATALDAFATITREKHVQYEGEDGAKIGDTVRILGGLGLVTSQGATFDRNTGLQQKLVIDERCPRLWGIFDYADYVYVGTEGNGVYRKNLKYGSGWENFSTGLDENSSITDLFVYKGLASCVTASGSAFVTLTYPSGGDWRRIEFGTLPTYSSYYTYKVWYESSSEEQAGLGHLDYYERESFLVSSGIKARAVTHNKLTGDVLFLVDTYSGDNKLGYYDTMSGFYPIESGTIFSGFVTDALTSPIETTGVIGGWESRAWVVEVKPVPVGATISGINIGPLSEVEEIDLVIASSYPIYHCWPERRHTQSGYVVDTPAPSGVTPAIEYYSVAGYDVEHDGINPLVSIYMRGKNYIKIGEPGGLPFSPAVFFPSEGDAAVEYGGYIYSAGVFRDGTDQHWKMAMIKTGKASFFVPHDSDLFPIISTPFAVSQSCIVDLGETTADPDEEGKLSYYRFALEDNIEIEGNQCGIKINPSSESATVFGLVLNHDEHHKPNKYVRIEAQFFFDDIPSSFDTYYEGNAFRNGMPGEIFPFKTGVRSSISEICTYYPDKSNYTSTTLTNGWMEGTPNDPSDSSMQYKYAGGALVLRNKTTKKLQAYLPTMKTESGADTTGVSVVLAHSTPSGFFVASDYTRYPQRLDVSQYSPLVVMQSGLDSMRSIYLTQSGISSIHSASGIENTSGMLVFDYRYASFAGMTPGENVSGYIYPYTGEPINPDNIMPYSGSRYVIFTLKDQDIPNRPDNELPSIGGAVSGVYSGIFLLPVDMDANSKLTDISVIISGVVTSGILASGIHYLLEGSPEMIETSNYCYPNQYVFVSTSGGSESGPIYRFYQKNPGKEYSGINDEIVGDFDGFIEYSSGLPGTRITTIRVEDMI